MSRPSLYTPELIEAICERLSEGVPLAEICRGEGMPAYRTVKHWQDTMADVNAAIAGAREAGEERIAADCLRIADTPMEGIEEKWEPVEIDNPDGPEAGPAKVTELQLTERKVGDMLGHRKLQIDTRLKLLAKFNPKKWGDKIEHGGHMSFEQLVAQSYTQPAEGGAEGAVQGAGGLADE